MKFMQNNQNLFYQYCKSQSNPVDSYANAKTKRRKYVLKSIDK